MAMGRDGEMPILTNISYTKFSPSGAKCHMPPLNLPYAQFSAADFLKAFKSMAKNRSPGTLFVLE